MSNAVSTETLEVAYQEISLLGGMLGSAVGAIAGALDVSASVSF
jgi:hypothetical protein